MILKTAQLWMETLKISDLVFCLLAVTIVCHVMVCLIFLLRRFLEQIFTMRQLNQLLKLLLVYTLIILPILSFIIWSRSIYSSVEPFDGEDGLHISVSMSYRSFSEAAGYGNQGLFAVILGIWIIGFFISGVGRYRKEIRVIRELKKRSSSCDDKDILEIKEKVQLEIGIKSKITLLKSCLVDVPFVFGFKNPIVFISEAPLQQDTCELVIRHELVHCKNKDCLYRRILFWLCKLYWFNPILRKLAVYYTEVNEMAIDESVLDKANQTERANYAAALIGMQQENKLPGNMVALTGHSPSQLERRLEHMKTVRTGTKRIVMFLAMCLLFLLCSVTTYASSFGTVRLQDTIVREISKRTDTEEEMLTDIWKEETDVIEIDDFADYEQLIQGRGASSVDKRVAGKTSETLGNVSVSAGDSIGILLKGDSTKDYFRAGYIDSQGSRTYVTSVNAEITYTFKVTKTGNYQIFVENLGTSKIRVTGIVTVY